MWKTSLKNTLFTMSPIIRWKLPMGNGWGCLYLWENIDNQSIKQVIFILFYHKQCRLKTNLRHRGKCRVTCFENKTTLFKKAIKEEWKIPCEHGNGFSLFPSWKSLKYFNVIQIWGIVFFLSSFLKMVVCFFRLEGVTYDTPCLLTTKFRS